MIKEVSSQEKTKIQSILNSMTLKELIGQTAIWHIGRIPFAPDDPKAVSEFLSEHPVGTIFVADMKKPEDKTMSQYISNCVACFQKVSKIPLLVSGDLEHGGGSVAKDLIKFPDMMAIGSANDRKLDYLFGKYTAIEGTSMGINWSFSPVVDMSRNWLNPIVSNRSLGNDPTRVSDAAAAIIDGMQEYGMAACAKHFPGDGVDFRDHHICTTVNSLSEEEWFSSYGALYKKLIECGVYSIMLGHIALPFMDSSMNSRGIFAPAAVSRPVVSELLRDRLGFQGLIVTDAVDMGGFMDWDVYDNRMIASLNCGVDAILWPNSTGNEYFKLVEDAVLDGRLPKERLIEAVSHVLEMKARLGLLDDSWSVETPSEEDRKIEADAAKCIAEKSISLVRNRDGILPLDPEKTKRILIGNMPRIKKGHTFPMDYLIDGLKARGIEIFVIEELDPVSLLNQKEQIGTDWDAFLMPFILPTHGLINTVRPMGDSARSMWATQMLEFISPIFISFSTPYLLCDYPYMQTLINAYSYNPYTVDVVIKALFGEIPFNGTAPVSSFYPLGDVKL